MKKLLYFVSGVAFIGLVALTIYVVMTSELRTDSDNTDTQVEFITQKDQEPKTYDGRMEKGEYFFEKGFLSLAATEFAFASQLDPKNVTPLLKLGHIYSQLEEYQKAEESLNAALQLDPNNQVAQILHGKIFIKKSDFEGARQYFLSVKQKSAELLYYLGLVETMIGDREKAYNYLVEAQKTVKDEALKAKIDEIFNAYTEFKLFPDSEVIFFQTLIGRSLNQIDEYEMAIFVLRNVLKEKVDYRDGWILLGYAYLSLEKYDFALTAFDKAYQLDPEKAETQYFLGLVYTELGKHKEAIVYLGIALKNGFEPQIQVKQKLADLYLETKQYEKSVQMYEDVLALNDDDSNTFVRPIWIYIEFLGDTDKALELAQKAFKKHPEDAMALNLIGWVYSEQGDLKQAEKYLKDAINKDKQLPAAYLNLGHVYKKQGNTKVALNLYQRAYKLDKFGSIGNLAAQNYNALVVE